MRRSRISDLAEKHETEVRWNELLSKHTSLRIGGRTLFFLRPKAWGRFPSLLHALWDLAPPFRILAGGTNLLVEDGDLGFGVLCLSKCGGSARWEGNSVEADADVPLAVLSAQAARRGLCGLEGLEGIPGTLGGGLVMNAGAWGQDLSGVVTSVALVRPGLGMAWVPAEECGFRYRGSRIPALGIAVGCRMRLTLGDSDEIRARCGEIRAKRRASQPQGCSTAGSVFKNPPGDHAGRILEELEYKGKRRGSAGFSEKHANFLVNHGGANFEEAFGICEEAKSAAASAGTPLDYEIRIWRRQEGVDE